MKKHFFISFLLILSVFLLVSCLKKAVQLEIATYYSMVFDLGFDAFQPIAEKHVDSGDRVLIVNTGKWLDHLSRRFEFEREKKKRKEKDEEKIKVYEPIEYMGDHPFFTEYLENGIVSSILRNRGKGFERLTKTEYLEDYINELRDNVYIFNTSFLDYDTWDDIKKDFDVNKILLYSINRLVDKEQDYIGIQIWLKFIDIDSGRILWDGIKNVKSSNYPKANMDLLERLQIEFSIDALSGFATRLREPIEDEGLEMPIDIVLVKTDDIPVFGNYPITIEDFILEQQLTTVLTELEGVNVLEKLHKRRYKEEWQLINAVFYINPFLGGDYKEFENYYGSKYMVAYKTLWAQQKDKDKEKFSGEVYSLNEKILGVNLKLIDMTDNGRIILTDFIPLAPADVLEANFLYNCYRAVDSLDLIVAALEETGVISEEENTAIVNMRMEVFKNYLLNNTTAYEAMYEMFAYRGEKRDILKQEEEILEHYQKVYWLFDPEKREKVNKHIYYIMAAHVVNGWFEEGLNHLLVENGYSVNEKLESIYSRYLIQKKYERDGLDESIFLSPLLLREWGANIKSFYDIDKVIYYIALERQTEVEFPTPEEVSKGLSAAEISQYYPLLAYELSRFLVSVLDVRTGDYVFTRNFDLVKGGTK